VELTKNPDAMISALRKIEGRGELPGATSAVMELCVDNPREGFADLFATHPSVHARIDKLVPVPGGRAPGPPRPPGHRGEEGGGRSGRGGGGRKGRGGFRTGRPRCRKAPGAIRARRPPPNRAPGDRTADPAGRQSPAGA